MDVLAAALLGVVQGVTEFLPVSSSAHLILARTFFGFDAERFGLAFDVACHVGTLAAVLVFFRQDILSMVHAVPSIFSGRTDPHVRRLWLIAAGTIPIVMVGLTLADFIEGSTRRPVVAATTLALGAGLLFLIERLRPAGKDESALGLGGAFLIGVAQAVALVPGVSRSGITIATGMGLGLARAAAARFTFLLSIPAILAAAAKEGLGLAGTSMSGADAVLFAVGMATSAAVGYLTIKYFLRFLVSHRLDVFAWYRLALAAVTFAYLFWA